ncbi:hypothetical protein ACTG16_22650 [Aeromonas sp. 23P]|uniref:hypothetical protein n=1 Tax=Aeromonas sp. 23P TaxID=3452716 RepID=UPI003F79E87D
MQLFKEKPSEESLRSHPALILIPPDYFASHAMIITQGILSTEPVNNLNSGLQSVA